MADKKLNATDADLLRRCTVTEDRIILPEQLSRPDYDSINKVIVNLGGKWNRGAKAHLFAKDPRPLVEEVLGTGRAIDQKKALQAFFTPPELAHRVVELAEVKGHVVLEPSAGEGALALACMSQHHGGAIAVHCVEIDEERSRVLNGLGFYVENRDFMTMQPKAGYSRIVMNPPFSKGQDIRHVAHALRFLAPGGKLVAIMSAGVIGKRAFEALSEGVDLRYTHNEEGSFKESGTNVRTITLEVWN